MRATLLTQLATLTAAAFVATGCGLSDPYKSRSGPPTPAGTTSAPRAASPRGADGPRTPSASAVPPSGGAGTPQAALTRFAQLYVNWRAGQLAEHSEELAAISTGQARAQALSLAGRAGALERYQVTNTGSVTAIAAGQGPERERFAVVTDETTSGAGPYRGLPATSHVTWATVAHTPNGYVVTGWYPTS